jgi:cytochrome d ubiquinol oxidase subunit I
MVLAGTLLLAFSLWVVVALARRRALPASRGFLRAAVAAGALAVLAMEAGWVVTEAGRQPWIVQGHMRVEEAVTAAPGTAPLLWVSVGVFALLGVFSWAVLRRLAVRLDPTPPTAGSPP